MARRKKTEKRELSHEDIPRNTRATAWRLLGRMARQWWKLLLVAGAALLSSASNGDVMMTMVDGKVLYERGRWHVSGEVAKNIAHVLEIRGRLRS